MPKTAMIRARMEPSIKHDAEAVFKTLGLSATEAITLFYKQVLLHRGLPFPVRIPNQTTERTMRKTLAGEDLTDWPSVDALKASPR